MASAVMRLAPAARTSIANAVNAAVSVAAQTGSGDGTADLLSVYLATDSEGKIVQRPGVVCSAIGGAEFGELVRVYVNLNDSPLAGPELNLLATEIRPFIKCGPREVFLEQGPESLKVFFRDAR